MVGLSNKTMQVHYTEFPAFDNHYEIKSKGNMIEWKHYSNKTFKNKILSQILIHTVLYIFLVTIYSDGGIY